MTKAELIERIIDAMVDPYTDCPEDYLYSTPINIYEATDLLCQIRHDEGAMELEPEDCLPLETTPALVMEAYNCLIRARKYEARTQRLAEFITDNECVCEYANYYYPEHEDAIDLVPVDFLWENFPFDIGDRTPNPLFLLDLAKRSKNFNSAEEYCWFDKEKDQLFSTDHPFGDGVLDAEAFARFILGDAEAFGYMFDHIIDEDEAKHILGCTKEAYINE